jgi:uncharacterized protein YndB with AHSA1/START domain
VSATTKHETEIHIDPDVPLFRVTREFDAPAAKVFRAHVDVDLFVQWSVPEGAEVIVDRWDAQTGGSWRYHFGAGTDEVALYGSFHEVRDAELIVHTFAMSVEPDAVTLTKVRFEDLGDGRCRLTETTILDSFEARDAHVSGADEYGMAWTHEKLDHLLTTF